MACIALLAHATAVSSLNRGGRALSPRMPPARTLASFSGPSPPCQMPPLILGPVQCRRGGHSKYLPCTLPAAGTAYQHNACTAAHVAALRLGAVDASPPRCTCALIWSHAGALVGACIQALSRTGQGSRGHPHHDTSIGSLLKPWHGSSHSAPRGCHRHGAVATSVIPVGPWARVFTLPPGGDPTQPLWGHWVS